MGSNKTENTFPPKKPRFENWQMDVEHSEVMECGLKKEGSASEIFQSIEEEIKIDGDSIKVNLSEVVETTDGAGGTLSKRAKKKLLKRQQWLDTKQERRQKERAKRKRNMEERKKDPEKFPDTRTVSRKRLKDCKMSDSKCKVGVAFDLQFEDLMNQQNMGKALKQIMKCYSINRRLPNPLQLHMTSFEGRVQQDMEKNDGYQNWDLNFHQGRFDKVFPSDDIVYLSSDSENVLTDLEENKVYIIGALVDHNHNKGEIIKSLICL